MREMKSYVDPYHRKLTPAMSGPHRRPMKRHFLRMLTSMALGVFLATLAFLIFASTLNHG